MVISLFVALLLAGAAGILFARALGMGRVSTSETLARIRSYGFGGLGEAGADGTGARGRLDALASRIGGLLLQRLHRLSEDELRAQLVSAGFYALSPRKFMGYRLLAAVFAPALWVWLVASGGTPVVLAVAGTFATAGAGWLGPMLLVNRRRRSRLDRIDYEMPELIDLLVVTVEAGVGFASSLRVAAERFQGPLGDELKLTIQEQTMGLTAGEALENMLGRCDTPATRSFVRSILQGETLGVSIGQIMRNLAVEMRKRRRALAEERAQKAPIKMLFPLVLLIFPSMFIVLLGPAVLALMKMLGGE